MIKHIDLTRKSISGYLGWYADHGDKAGVQVLEQKINEMIDMINRIANKKEQQ